MELLPQDVVDYYDVRAEGLAHRYDSVDFRTVHSDLLPFLPKAGARILDVGSGSGRDAIALAKMDYRVTAAEPSDKLRRHSISNDTMKEVLWLDDRLPELKKIASGQRDFDFVLCSAVLMLLDVEDLTLSLKTLAHVLRDFGVLAVTVRSPSPSDEDRFHHGYSDSFIASAAAQHGLSQMGLWTKHDSLGRPDLEWRTFIFRKSGTPVAGQEMRS